MKALIVDDSPFLRKELREMVSRTGIDQVFEAANGNEALEHCEAEQPDLILLDLVMDGMDGVTFLEEVRKREARTGHVVVVSAIGKDAVKENVQELGAARFLEKPVGLEDVQDVVDHVRDQ